MKKAHTSARAARTRRSKEDKAFKHPIKPPYKDVGTYVGGTTEDLSHINSDYIKNSIRELLPTDPHFMGVLVDDDTNEKATIHGSIPFTG